ncbi:MAG TPA: DUF2007 domain-containing protein [Gammaproteobacteria bacterium]|jgi:hypothetical protein|nr:DUF2007 domain-containing protein [Gammaproteobacteria bacterium]
MDDYVTIATFGTAPAAHIALGRLRADGFDARLVDEHIVRAIAIGGIRLQVRERQVEAAQRVLATDYSDELDERE